MAFLSSSKRVLVQAGDMKNISVEVSTNLPQARGNDAHVNLRLGLWVHGHFEVSVIHDDRGLAANLAMDGEDSAEAMLKILRAAADALEELLQMRKGN